MFEDIASMRAWFDEHDDCFITPYIEQNFPEESWNYQYQFMQQHLFFTKKIITDDITMNEKKIKMLLECLLKKGQPGKICLVEGEMGGGKTGFACYVLDEMRNDRFKIVRSIKPRYFFVTKSPTKPALPTWLKVIEDVKQLENNSFAIIDEGAINLNARRAMTRTNVEASMELVKLRQKGITLIILVQHGKMVDPNVRRLASLQVLKKGSSLFGMEEKNDEIVLIRRRLKARKVDEAYFEKQNSGFFFKINHTLPEWWDDEKVSKYMKNWSNKEPEVLATKGTNKHIGVENESPY